jgi:hypothetical protein
MTTGHNLDVGRSRTATISTRTTDDHLMKSRDLSISTQLIAQHDIITHNPPLEVIYLCHVEERVAQIVPLSTTYCTCPIHHSGYVYAFLTLLRKDHVSLRLQNPKDHALGTTEYGRKQGISASLPTVSLRWPW